MLGGADPARDRSMAKGAPTVASLGEDFLKDVDARRKPSTSSEYRRLWTKHVIPELGSKRVAEIAGVDLSKLHRSLATTPYIANRLVLLRHLLEQASRSARLLDSWACSRPTVKIFRRTSPGR